MSKFTNKHKDETCYIAANGPGLNNIDSSKLAFPVFALNRGYLKKDLPITYLVVVNDLVEKQFKDEILAVECEQVFSNSIPGTVQLKWTPDVPSFQPNPIDFPSWQGHTVTFVALQLAFEMGFSTVYLIGLDHHFSYQYTKKEKGKRGLISTGLDVNHFDSNYFGEGVVWDAANLTKSEEAFKLADEYYREHGRVIYNVSKPTRLSSEIIKSYREPKLYI